MRQITTRFVFLLMVLFSINTAHAVVQMDSNNWQEILASPQPVVIDVYTGWCWPCKIFAPVFEEASNALGDQFLFVKLDAEKDRAVARALGVRAYPTVLFFKDGQEVGRLLGSASFTKLTQEIHRHLGP